MKLPKDFVWIPEFEGHYAINTKGRIMSFKGGNPKLLRRLKTVDGYIICRLSKNGFTYQFSLHRLMYKIFKPEENIEGIWLTHLDGDKTNNDINNISVFYDGKKIKIKKVRVVPKIKLPTPRVNTPIATIREIKVQYRNGVSERELLKKHKVTKSLLEEIIKNIRRK